MINEIEALRQELAQTKLAYQMAAQLSQFKTGFLAKIAHELRSPLSSLMGLHQLILSDLCESPEEEREFIGEAYQTAQKLMNIIDEIIVVSKIEYGQITLQTKIIPLTEILNNLEQSTHLQATNYTLKLDIISPLSEIYILVDQQRLLQALITLVDTGISLANRGTIQISTHINDADSLVQLMIDIPCSLKSWEQEQPPLDSIELTLEYFKEFSKKVEMSPGLKLLLCQTLLESMGGQISLSNSSSENSSEETTRLLVLIPLASAQKIALLETEN